MVNTWLICIWFGRTDLQGQGHYFSGHPLPTGAQLIRVFHRLKSSLFSRLKSEMVALVPLDSGKTDRKQWQGTQSWPFWRDWEAAHNMKNQVKKPFLRVNYDDPSSLRYPIELSLQIFCWNRGGRGSAWKSAARAASSTGAAVAWVKRVIMDGNMG